MSELERARELESALRETPGLSKAKLAREMGVDRSEITHILNLLRLPYTIQDMLSQGKITAGHARRLARIDPGKAIDFAYLIIDEKWTVAQLEKEIRAWRSGRPEGQKQDGTQALGGRNDKPVEVVRLEEDISAYLGSPFTIEDAGNGTGRLVIEYGSSEIRDGLLEKIYPSLLSEDGDF